MFHFKTIMQKLHIFFSNLKQQNLLSVLIISVVSNAIYSIWFQIPYVVTTLFMTLWYIVNFVIAVIGLSLLIPKKGALVGFTVGAIVATFFSLNAFFSSYISAPVDMLPSIKIIILTYIGLLLFYALPGALLGHMRKE